MHRRASRAILWALTFAVLAAPAHATKYAG
jgi:hypothetical protein